MNVLAVPFLALVLAVATLAPSQPEVTSVRFPVPRLMVTKSQSGSSTYIRGPVRVDMSFKKAVVRTPVLKVACLCQQDGILTCYWGLWNRLKTNATLKTTDIAEAFKVAGFEPEMKERESSYKNPQLVSAKLCGQACRGEFAGASYGSASGSDGLFRIGSSATSPKLLLFRFELWQNGVLVGNYESSRIGLGKLDIPEDWHVWQKYPQKFKYVTR